MVSMVLLYFVYGICQGVPSLAMWAYWEDSQQMSASFLSLLFSLAGLPALFKPLVALIIDNFPLHNTPRRGYVVTGCLLASLVSFVIPTLIHIPLGVAFCQTLLEIIFVWTDSSLDGMMVFQSKNYDNNPTNSRLTARCATSKALGRVVGSVYSGLFAHSTSIPWWTVSVGLVALSYLVGHFIQEGDVNRGSLRAAIKQLFSISRHFLKGQGILLLGMPVFVFILMPQPSQGHLVWLREHVGLRLWEMAFLNVGDHIGYFLGGVTVNLLSGKRWITFKVWITSACVFQALLMAVRGLLFPRFDGLVLCSMVSFLLQIGDNMALAWVTIPFLVIGSQRAIPGYESLCFSLVRSYEVMSMILSGLTSSLLLQVTHVDARTGYHLPLASFVTLPLFLLPILFMGAKAFTT